MKEGNIVTSTLKRIYNQYRIFQYFNLILLSLLTSIYLVELYKVNNKLTLLSIIVVIYIIISCVVSIYSLTQWRGVYKLFYSSKFSKSEEIFDKIVRLNFLISPTLFIFYFRYLRPKDKLVRLLKNDKLPKTSKLTGNYKIRYTKLLSELSQNKEGYSDIYNIVETKESISSESRNQISLLLFFVRIKVYFVLLVSIAFFIVMFVYMYESNTFSSIQNFYLLTLLGFLLLQFSFMYYFHSKILRLNYKNNEFFMLYVYTCFASPIFYDLEPINDLAAKSIPTMYE